jgi:hypothetical protein
MSIRFFGKMPYSSQSFANNKEMKHKQNPYILKTKKGKRLTKVESLNITLDAIQSELVIAKEEINDKTPFTKVYYHNFDFLLKLNKQGLRLFCYIAKNLVNFNQDTVYLYKEDYFDKMRAIEEKGISDSSFYEGISNLNLNNIIAESTKPYIYYINPNVFFRGERRYLLLEL